jgi:hypothetical protein
MRSSLAVLGFVLLSGCGHGAETTPTTSNCPAGVCGNGTGGAASTGTSSGGGASGSSSSGGACIEAWTCTPWQQGTGGQYARTCTDASACGTTAQKPTEGPVNLPELDLDYYRCQVEPILDRGCAMIGCHGTETGRPFKVYARGRLRHQETVAQVGSCPVGPQMVDLAQQGSGTVMCVGWSPHTAAEWQSNYDIARSFMLGITDPEQSDLLAQPVIGGKSHAGVHLFAKGDAEHATLKAWLGGAKLGSTCNPAPN